MELSFHLAHKELALQQGRGVWVTPTAATALGTGLAQLWMSPVPAQLPWLTQHVPEPCSGSLPQQQDAACSHSSLNPLGRQLAAGVWDGKAGKGVLGCQGVLILLDSSQIPRAGRAATARPGVGCAVQPCFAKERALPSSLQGKKVACITFFSPLKHCRSLLFISQWDSEGWEPPGNSKTSMGWSKTCPILHLRAGPAGG